MKTTCDSVIEWIGKADWGDVPAWVVALLTGPAVVAACIQIWQTSKQSRKAQKAHEDSLRPVVVAFFEPNRRRPEWIDFVVKNAGEGTAYDVSFDIVSRPTLSKVSANGPFWEAKFLVGGIGVLARGQEIRTVVDSADARGDAGWPDGVLTIKSKYFSVNENPYGEEISVDMNFLKGSYQFIDRETDRSTRKIGGVSHSRNQVE